MTEGTREIRKQLMIMVALVLVIDAIAIAVFNTMDIGDTSRGTRTMFTAAWTVVTLAVVLNGLYRIRQARGRRGTPRPR